MQSNIPGTYILVMQASEPITVQIGIRRSLALTAGHYLYVGSALGGLWQRLGRHCSTQKRVRWHVDYLLQSMPLVEAWYRVSEERLECAWSRALASFDRLRAVDAIGASDCACRTHLYGSEKRPDASWFAHGDALAAIQRWTPPDSTVPGTIHGRR